MSKEIFAIRIKELRMAQGLTMEQLAQSLAVTKSRINMWENGSAIPREDLLIELSKLFSVSIDYLLGNDTHEGMSHEELHYIHRNLKKLNQEDLKKAENVLKAMFNDIFDSEEEDHGDL